MRILVVLPPFEVYSPANGGAVSTVAEGLARAWGAAGHDVVVLGASTTQPYSTGQHITLDFPRGCPRSRSQRLQAGAERRLRRHDWPDYTHYARQVLGHVEILRPDRLVLHNDMVLPALLTPPQRRSACVHVHNQVAVRHPARARRALSEAGGVVAVSDFIRDDVARRFAPSALVTIPNGVDVGAFRPERPRAWGGASPLRIAYVGRLLRDKGPHVLIDAVQELRSSGVRVDLTVVGSPDFSRAPEHDADPYVQEVRRRVRSLDGAYLPHVGRAEVPAVLQRQDVLVVPSLFPEPFGLVVLEGMAAGCVVLASEIGGLPQAVGSAGMLFPAGDAGALAALVRRLVEQPEEATARMRAGSEHARQHDWSRVAGRWLALLEESS